MISFYWRCFKTAVRGAWGITSFAVTICAIVLAVVGTVVVDQHPNWASEGVIAQLNAIGGWIVPATIFSFFFIVRLFLAPYWLWREMADKVARADLAIPHIIVLPLKCTARAQVAKNHTEKWMASVDVTVHLENRGPGEAHNYEIAAYSCWMRKPDDWDWWTEQYFARWPVGGAVEFHFLQSTIAEDKGGGVFGFPGGTELVFVLEVMGRVNAAEGKSFENEQIWLTWDVRHPDRFVPPNAAIVGSMQPHLARFKASIPK